MFKRTLLILGAIGLTLQLTGCYMSVNDHHYHPFWHHEEVVVVHR